jgi:hypothetical protein
MSLGLLASLALSGLVAVAPQADLAELRAALRGDVRADRLAACRAIAALEGEARAEGIGLLVVERRRGVSRLSRTVRRVDGLVGSLDRARAARSERVASWEAAAREALGAIFDQQEFPTPVGPIHGPHEGYEQVMERCAVAVELYGELRRQADKDLREVLRLEREEAAEQILELDRPAERVADLDQALSAMGETVEPPPRPAPLPLALLRLMAGDWPGLEALDVTGHVLEGVPRPACQEGWFPPPPEELERTSLPWAHGPSGGRLEGYARFLFHHALGELVEARNTSVEMEGASAAGRGAVAALNRYRRALGLRPLQLHPALTRAMRDHLWSLRELSHEGATPQTRTPAQRTDAAGYPATHGTGENLSDSDLLTSIEQWKWDGGHHRILAHPCMVHIGVFQTAFSGMLVAAGEAPELPAPLPMTFDL